VRGRVVSRTICSDKASGLSCCPVTRSRSRATVMTPTPPRHARKTTVAIPHLDSAPVGRDNAFHPRSGRWEQCRCTSAARTARFLLS
jgi:hypothetical protein